MAGGGIDVRSGVTLRLTGRGSRAGWALLGRLAQPGAATLVLDDALAAGVWEAGNKVVVSTMTFHRCQSVGQNEERAVAAVLADSRAVTLSKPLAFALRQHAGAVTRQPPGGG